MLYYNFTTFAQCVSSILNFEHRGKTSTTFDSLISKYITKRGSKSDGSTGVSSVQLTNSANTRKTNAIDSINTIVDRVRTNILAGKNRLVIENTLNNNSTCNSNSGGNGKCWWVTPKKWNMLHWSAYTNNYDMVNYLLLGKLGGGVQKLKQKNSFTSQQQITSAPSSSNVNGVDGVYGGSPELLSRNDAFGCAPIHLAARSDSVHALRHMCMAVQKIEKHSTRMTKKNSTNEKERILLDHRSISAQYMYHSMYIHNTVVHCSTCSYVWLQVF